jgi:hypothetical protein
MNRETYQETIDRIARRDGLDLIVNELEASGFKTEIKQTGGFCLVVGVYGVDGYIWADNEIVCFYTNDEEDKGEELIIRRDEETNEEWAVNVRRTYKGAMRYIGVPV